MDRNQDEMIDASEFEADFLRNTTKTDPPDDGPDDPAAQRKLMESLFPQTGDIEYVSADGKKKKMPREQLFDKMQQQDEIMAAMKSGGSRNMGPNGYQAGALPKETSGTLKMDEVEKENPSLHRMILVARAAWNLVVTAGEPNGTMVAMSTKEADDEDGEEQSSIVKQQVKPRKGPLVRALLSIEIVVKYNLFPPCSLDMLESHFDYI